jgi:hypothetical protein
VDFFRAAFSVMMLVLLTAGLCWFATYFVELNPLLGLVLMLLGSFGIVIVVDIIQAHIPP